MEVSKKNMDDELEKWGNFITNLVERKKHEVKDKVIKGSRFLSFLNNSDEWGKMIDVSSSIEKYYRRKEIQPTVIDPNLMYSIISGSEGYKFAENFISNTLDKAAEYFGSKGIDDLFISEICNKDNYLSENLFENEKNEKGFESHENILELLRNSIIYSINKGIKKENLILMIGKEMIDKIMLSSFPSDFSEYQNLKRGLGLVIERYGDVPKNNFQFALINKGDLKFRWIFWELKLNYNIFNLYTYIPLHVWYNVEKGENFASNSIAYLKNKGN
ncbi:MAG: hypothetical protein mread185_000240 [Mycoplasmataceae bacterium]|nr:MAG: hypothetical protein mread185_000240 [Mycoplasmataceae bacterium]